MRDFKDYRASDGIGHKLTVVIGLVGLLAILGWMGERDHQARIDQIRSACEVDHD